MSDLATKMHELAQEWRDQAQNIYDHPRSSDDYNRGEAETLNSCARQLDEWVQRSGSRQPA